MANLLDDIVPPDVQRSLERGTVVTIGNFDGVHRGHQTIINDVITSAARHHRLSFALTFEPHPAELFTDKTAEEYRIATADERVELLEFYGIDRVITVPFTRDFAELPPEEFVTGLLIERLHAAEIHIGYDFAFGRGRAGNTRSLQRICDEYDVRVVVQKAVGYGEAPISSTRVREELRGGRIEQATALLGHLYTITGPQVRGHSRGTEIGIPTINLAAEKRMIPRLGVYASLIRLGDGQWRRSITNIGARPTFEAEGAAPNIETHVLDGDPVVGDAGTQVRLALLSWIRAEQRFDSAAALKEQIANDVKRASAAHHAYLESIDEQSLQQTILPAASDPDFG